MNHSMEPESRLRSLVSSLSQLDWDGHSAVIQARCFKIFHLCNEVMGVDRERISDAMAEHDCKHVVKWMSLHINDGKDLTQARLCAIQAAAMWICSVVPKKPTA